MPFTPFHSTLGGLILSLSTSSLLSSKGRVLGISGLTHSTISSSLSLVTKARTTATDNGVAWKASAVAGLVVGGWMLPGLVGEGVFDGVVEGVGLGRVVLAGLAVGLGTKLGSGCTSGHMLCGLSRFSKRSLIATLSFFSSALLIAQLFPSSLSSPSLQPPLPSLSLPTLLTLFLPFPLYTFAPYLLPSSFAELVSSFFLGVHFSFGLALAGMTAPSKVLSFFYLPIPGLPLSNAAGRDWDPSLAMVALGGLLPNTLVYSKVIKTWQKPLHNTHWELPTRKEIDWKLVFGSVMFGVGWGLQGICPGPMLTVLGSGTNWKLMVPFGGAFAVGGLIGGLF